MQKQISILPLKLRDELKFAPKTRGTRSFTSFYIFLLSFHAHMCAHICMCVCVSSDIYGCCAARCCRVLVVYISPRAGSGFWVSLHLLSFWLGRPEVCLEIALMPRMSVGGIYSYVSVCVCVIFLVTMSGTRALAWRLYG